MNDKQLIALLKAENQDLQDQLSLAPENGDDLNLERVKARVMQAALDRAGSVTEAAKLLGIDRVTMHRCLFRYRLKRGPKVPTYRVNFGVA